MDAPWGAMVRAWVSGCRFAMLLLDRLRCHAAHQPGDATVAQASDSLTYPRLAQLTHDLATLLAARLTPGSRVLLCAPNRAAYHPAFLGVLAAQRSVFPLAPDLAGPEMLAAAQRAGAAAMITLTADLIPLSSEFAKSEACPALAPEARLWTVPSWAIEEDAGVAMLLLSSGTMGRPKIVRRDAQALDEVARNMAEAIGFTSADRVLAAMPLCHSYGIEHGLLAPLWAGSSVRLCDGFDVRVCLRELQAGATIFPGVPFMFEMLCKEESQRLAALRRAYSAGAPLPRSLHDAFFARFGVPVSQLYGASEVGSVTYNDPQIEPFDPQSVGRPMRDVRIRILDPDEPSLDRPLPIGEEGHVAISAPSRMSGYLDDDPSPMLDGFFLTGDLGRVDASGALTITGRIKLLIDIGGRKVNPLEVEQVIQMHPAVGACVVVPMRVSQTLFRLKAIVAPAREDVTPDVRELRDLAKRQLSSYKVPRLFEIRASLPHSPTGKLLRHLIA